MTAPARIRQSDADRLLRAARANAGPDDAVELTLSPNGAVSVRIERRAANDHGGPGSSWDDA